MIGGMATTGAPLRLGFGVPISGGWATPANQLRLVQRAEELGYHSAWTFQRLLVPLDPDARAGVVAYRSVLDAVIPLAFVASQTSRIRLGTAVLNLPFWSPPLLAKQLGTLDVLSGGRLDVGLGIGWNPVEFTATGAQRAQRGARAEEFLAALRALWDEEVVEFHGRWYEIPASRMDPKPVQRPHPPLLLGGSAAPALRRAGRLADGWISASNADLAHVDQPIAAVKQAAREAGRDPEALRFVSRGPLRVRPAGHPDRRPLQGSYDEIHADLDRLREQGVTEVFFDLNYDPEFGSPDADPAASLERAEEILEALAPAAS
jgi:probable F420-dependent oxidoreductase